MFFGDTVYNGQLGSLLYVLLNKEIIFYSQ